MKRFAFIALAAWACRRDDPPSQQLPDGGRCATSTSLQAWAAETPQSDGTVDVFGSAHAHPGVTIRALFVASTRVPLTEFNYRIWSLSVPADQVAAITRNGYAELPVMAITSVGCELLEPPLRVRVSSVPDAATNDPAAPIDAGPTPSEPLDAGDAEGGTDAD